MKIGGRVYSRGGKLWVDSYTSEGRVRKATGKEDTPANRKWCERNFRDLITGQKREIPKTFIQFAHIVLEASRHKRDVACQKDYLTKLRLHIAPVFSKYELSDIKALDIEKWQNMLLNKGLSQQTVKRCRSILSMVFKKAVGNDLIAKNPCDYAESISVFHKKKPPYKMDEVRSIFKAAEGKGFIEIYLKIAFGTGMRVGEILALKWEDIDFSNNVIYLCRSISKGKIKGDTHQKNHQRLVVMPQFVVDALKKAILVQSCEWVFPSPRTQEPYAESKTLVKYHFKPLLEEAGVSYKTLMATRHTYISTMRNQGLDKSLVQEIVGHAEGSDVTDKHYFSPEINAIKVQSVNNVFEKTLLQKAQN